MITYLICIALAYAVGFACTFIMIARSDGRRRYEQDPFDATLLALFWPVIWGAYIVMSIVKLVSKPLCFVYNRSYEIARRKKRGQ